MAAKQKTLSLEKIKNQFESWLTGYSEELDHLTKSHPEIWIAIAAGLGLFIELTIIRIHSSYFQLFAYLKNVSLLSCFLGLGIGYARGSKKILALPLVLPFLSIQIISLALLRFTSLSAILQNPISEQVTLGLLQTESRHQLVFIYLFVIAVFLFNALCFIPLGQLASRLMLRRQSLSSYSWNLVGSLLGIVLFSVISFLWLPPQVWFTVSAVALMVFTFRNKIATIISAIFVILTVIILSISFHPNQYDIYSPYQILTLVFNSQTPPILQTSNSYYQKILDLRKDNVERNPSLKASNDYYSIPYTIKPNPGRVLVVGSGTGNDVAAAVRNNAGHVDAVEIDPAILDIGKELHPEAPYSKPNVTAYSNDARNFIRYTNNKYDLIVYGLLDSHTLLSGRGGIRLDSYVYTVEGFKEARAKLNNDGVISLTFALLNSELGNKLYLMLQQAFDGKAPLVYYSKYDGGYTFLAGDGIKNAPINPLFDNVTTQFGQMGNTSISTDDWPFFYMLYRKYPMSSIALILILLASSFFVIRKFVGKVGSAISIPCFFLGAGFMLIETKGVTELALTYGSTWYVNSIVIIFILLMGFLANLYVMKKGSLNHNLMYFLLFISIIVSLSFTYIKFSGAIVNFSKIIMPIGLTLPMFFSGMVFSSELKKTGNIKLALYSNLLGAMLGGFLEYNSLYFGFRSLYVIALIMYLFAFMGSGKNFDLTLNKK